MEILRSHTNDLSPSCPNPLILLARPARFERATPGFGGQYSIQLSYGRLGGAIIEKLEARLTLCVVASI